MSKGLNTFGGYVGGAAAIAGAIFFMVGLGSDSDEPIMSIVMYGGLTSQKQVLKQEQFLSLKRNLQKHVKSQMTIKYYLEMKPRHFQSQL